LEGREATVAMKKLFIAMSSATRKKDYKNLVPWDLFRDDTEANSQGIMKILESEIGIPSIDDNCLYLDSNPSGPNFVILLPPLISSTGIHSIGRRPIHGSLSAKQAIYWPF
jgi:hypothetical protein